MHDKIWSEWFLPCLGVVPLLRWRVLLIHLLRLSVPLLRGLAVSERTVSVAMTD